MKKLFYLLVFLSIASCGSGGGGTGAHLGVSDFPSRIEQDLVCNIAQTDQNGNTTYIPVTAAAQEVTFNINYSSLCSSSFNSLKQDLLFEGCSVSVSPVSNLPDELKSQDFLNEMAQEISCTSDDVPSGGSATARISLTSSLVNQMRDAYENPNYKHYAPFLYKINVVYRFSPSCGDGTVKKTVSLLVEFSNFIKTQNDLCQE